MEDYERIKNLAADVIKENNSSMNLMKQWKAEIRKALMNVREQFLLWIDNMTNQFIESFKVLDQQKDIKQFRGEDRRLNQQLEGLRDKYMQIMRIFTLISNCKAEQKADTIEKYRQQMSVIENEVVKQSNHIKSQVSKIKETQKKIVAIDGLKQKLEVKYFQYFEKKLSMMRQAGTHNETLNVSLIQSKINQGMRNNDQINFPKIESSTRVQTGAQSTPVQSQYQNNHNFDADDFEQRMSMNTLDLSDIKQFSDNRRFVDQSMSILPDFLDFNPTQQEARKQNQEMPKVQPQKIQQSIQSQSTPKQIQHQNANQDNSTKSNTQSTLSKSNEKPQQNQPQQTRQSFQSQQQQQLQQTKQQQEESKSRPTQELKLTKEALEKLGNVEPTSRGSIKKVEDMFRRGNSSFSESNGSASYQNSVLEASTISRYRHKNQNSIYYLRPQSKEIYLLDFKLQGFVKEQIYSQILLPKSFSSAQLQSGCIYIMGGLYPEPKKNVSCLQIDQNMSALEKEPMPKGPRYNLAIALLLDKYIFCIGGQDISTEYPLTSCEVYDANNNCWYQAPSMTASRASISACTFNHRYIYVFPGSNSSSQSTLELLDLGTFIEPNEFKKASWQLFILKNSSLQKSFGFGSVQMNQNEILVFGGNTGQTYNFETSVCTNKKVSALNLTKSNEIKFNHLKKSVMCSGQTQLCHNSDFLARIFGNYLYALDSEGGNLHVYAIKEKQWNYSTLRELGIN
eukprot:403337466